MHALGSSLVSQLFSVCYLTLNHTFIWRCSHEFNSDFSDWMYLLRFCFIPFCILYNGAYSDLSLTWSRTGSNTKKTDSAVRTVKGSCLSLPRPLLLIAWKQEELILLTTEIFNDILQNIVSLPIVFQFQPAEFIDVAQPKMFSMFDSWLRTTWGRRLNSGDLAYGIEWRFVTPRCPSIFLQC